MVLADAVDQGKKATSKDVYQNPKLASGRADGNGAWSVTMHSHMIKGWSADAPLLRPDLWHHGYGDAVIDGRTYHFDKNTGVRQ
ncbi:MAG: hypothetical protein ACLUJU_05355 [Subdoligranulum sp.]